MLSGDQMLRRPSTLLLLATLLASVPAYAQLSDDGGSESEQPRNKVTTTPRGHPIVNGRPSDQLRDEARDLRQRADDVREAADAIREAGKDEERAEDLDDRADYLEDRARILDMRADDEDTQGSHAAHGLALPAPSPALQ